MTDTQRPKPKKPQNFRPSSNARLIADLERFHKDLTRVLPLIAPSLQRCQDRQAGQPEAMSYDSVISSGTRTIPWCFEHGTGALHFLDVLKKVPCPMDQVPVHGDPTGDAATSRDPERERELAIVKALKAMIVQGDKAIGEIVTLGSRGPSKKDLRETAAENEVTTFLCANHARVGEHAHPHTQNPTDVGGRLPEKMLLCEFCFDSVRKTAYVEGAARLPTKDEMVPKNRLKMRAPGKSA